MNDMTPQEEHEVIRSLGRIEERCESNGERLNKIEERLSPLEIDVAVAKHAGGKEGRKWGAIVSAAVAAAIAATAKAFGG
ncbi:MAG: hypothetical protein ACYTFQ_00030 [Planctomycetota bacterium]|jgi:hypothetical protein